MLEFVGTFSIALKIDEYTDKSYYLVKHFLDFPLWEYTIASFNQRLLFEGSHCVLPERGQPGNVLLASRKLSEIFLSVSALLAG